MIVYGLWNGGANYSDGTAPQDMERFRGVAHASYVLRQRERNGGHVYLPTYYVLRENATVLFPCVQGSSMDLYPDPEGGEPWARLTIGPRGGVVRQVY